MVSERLCQVFADSPELKGELKELEERLEKEKEIDLVDYDARLKLQKLLEHPLTEPMRREMEGFVLFLHSTAMAVSSERKNPNLFADLCV